MVPLPVINCVTSLRTDAAKISHGTLAITICDFQIPANPEQFTEQAVSFRQTESGQLTLTCITIASVEANHCASLSSWP